MLPLNESVILSLMYEWCVISMNKRPVKIYRPLILYWMLELAYMGEISDVAAQAVV